MVKAEIIAHIKYADELLEMGLEEIRTSDEFQVASVSFYSYLSKAGVFSVNTAHGIGCFCPYIYYDEFYVINKIQADFYRKRNTKINYKLRNTTNQRDGFENKMINTSGFDPVIVYFHQNFEDYGLIYESTVQDNLIMKAIEISQNLKLKFLIKLHPNLSQKKTNILKLKYKVKVIRDLNEIENKNPIFLNIKSTAYFDYIKIGPILTYKEGSLTPELYYGEDLFVVTQHNIIHEVGKLKTQANWINVLKKQKDLYKAKYSLL